MPQTERSTKGRLGSRKSVTGCVTCKIRKIKCDELKPMCRRCTSTGRKCDGYTQYVGSHSIALKPPPKAYANIDGYELRSFEFFVKHVVPNFSQINSQVFWCGTVLQLSKADAIVWNAVVALSRLVQYPQRGVVYDISAESRHEKPPIDDPEHARALRWYNKYITMLRERLALDQVSSAIARVSCVIYICIECLQSNIREAINLHHQATALARAAKSQPRLECDVDLEKTLGAFMRHMSLVHNLPVLERDETLKSADDTLSALSQAREELYLLMRDAYKFCSGMEEIKLTQGKDWTASPTQKRLSQEIHTKLTNWMSTLNGMPGLSLALLREHQIEMYSILLLAYSHFTIWLNACLSTYETAYDSFFTVFKSMVEHAGRAISATRSASRPVFVFEARIIPMMFFVAVRCRHPIIRRDAISMLRNGPQIENTWRADSMAQLAELNVAIEESGNVHGVFSSEPLLTEPPPESHRIFRSKAVELLDESGRPVQFLRFARWQQDVNSKWVQKEDEIKIGP